MSLVNYLETTWRNESKPFIIHGGNHYFASDILNYKDSMKFNFSCGDVVAICGDFDAFSLSLMIKLLDINAIVVFLTKQNESLHEKMLLECGVDYYVKDKKCKKLKYITNKSQLITDLQTKNKGGLIFFSTGTSGKPKAILLSTEDFMHKFYTKRPSFTTLSFLMFDHLGGINTLFHALFNKGTIIVPLSRSIEHIFDLISKYKIEVLPTTPTFLRMLILSGKISSIIPDCLKIISYGTERMDQQTLNVLCEKLPNIDFRQTYGLTELGVFRVKSESRNSLFMKIGGEGVQTKIEKNILFIKNKNGMLGYLNAESPFDEEGWYNTKDIVEKKEGYIKIVGRKTDIVNVGGQKFLLSEVEDVVMKISFVNDVKLIKKDNPITGQHIEMVVKTNNDDIKNLDQIKKYLDEYLPKHMRPQRIKIGEINVGHRFKKS